MKPLEPLQPMKPMQPMRPMEPLSFGEPWWPDDLGHPSTSGAQNDLRYAVFPEARRLLIEDGGRLTTYDSADHRIGGVSQQNGTRRSLTFSSQHGPVRLDDLQVIGAADDHSRKRSEGSPRDAGSKPRSTAPRDDASRAPSSAERVVYTEESAAGGSIKLIVSGAIDEDIIEALEDFLKRQRRRLERRL